MIPLRIAVVAPSAVPFVRGGAERMCEGLVDAINATTPHSADLIRLPSHESSLTGFLDSYEQFALLDLSHFDLVVSCKYPAWMVDHPNHIVYMQHTARLYYELYPRDLPTDLPEDVPELTSLRDLLARAPLRPLLDGVLGAAREAVASLGPDHPAFELPGPVVRCLLPWLDHVAMRSASRHFAISATVAHRKGYFPHGIEPRVLIPPSGTPGLRSGEYGDYFFTASRLEDLKRVDLLIDAMRYVSGPVKLKIVGDGNVAAALRRRALGDPRIEFLGSLPDRDLAELYANALAVPFVPFDEDLGLITLEAAECAKAVVTCRDSGGPTEIVVHGQTGLIANPTPEDLGAALASLARNPTEAQRMGEVARDRIRRYSWQAVLDTLLTPRPPPPSIGPLRGRRRVVVATTASAWPPMHEHSRRAYQIARSLLPDFDVILVAPHNSEGDPLTLPTEPGLIVHLVPEQGRNDLPPQCAAPWHLPREMETLFPTLVQTVSTLSARASATILLDPGFLPAVTSGANRLSVGVDVGSIERHTGGDIQDPNSFPADFLAAHDPGLVSTWGSEAAGMLHRAGIPENRLCVLPQRLVEDRDPASVERDRQMTRLRLAHLTGIDPSKLRVILIDPVCPFEWNDLLGEALRIAEICRDALVVYLAGTTIPPLSLPTNLLPVPGISPRRLGALIAAADGAFVVRAVACAVSELAVAAHSARVPLILGASDRSLLGVDDGDVIAAETIDMADYVTSAPLRPAFSSRRQNASLPLGDDLGSRVRRMARPGCSNDHLPWRVVAPRPRARGQLERASAQVHGVDTRMPRVP